MLNLRYLKCGDLFHFEHSDCAYEYYGEGWYGWPYSGGPWHTRDNPRVFRFSLEAEEGIRRRKKRLLGAA